MGHDGPQVPPPEHLEAVHPWVRRAFGRGAEGLSKGEVDGEDSGSTRKSQHGEWLLARLDATQIPLGGARQRCGIDSLRNEPVPRQLIGGRLEQ